jgi:hypothetical protein
MPGFVPGITTLLYVGKKDVMAGGHDDVGRSACLF